MKQKHVNRQGFGWFMLGQLCKNPITVMPALDLIGGGDDAILLTVANA